MATTGGKRNRMGVQSRRGWGGARPVPAFNLNKQTKNFPESLEGVAVCAETRLIEAASHSKMWEEGPSWHSKLYKSPEMGRAFARSRVINKVFLNTLSSGVQDLTLEGRARSGAWAMD